MNMIHMNFSNEFQGRLKTENGVVEIGKGTGQFLPYELLMGALGSCLYSTFLDIVQKMRLEIKECDLAIDWEKRTEVPTTCKLVFVKAAISGGDPQKQEKLIHAFKLATEYCSIYQTLSQVSEMKYEVTFKE